VLDDLGLVPALRNYCHRTSQRFGVTVDYQTIGLDEYTRLPGEIEVAIYRIGQEALTNAVRHGRARFVEVLLQRKTASVLAIVQDDGQGFDATQWNAQCRRKDCLGLLGIEERALLLGGTLCVESSPGIGTSLYVEIPYLEGAHA
jgi:signal transduction histidine kinase